MHDYITALFPPLNSEVQQFALTKQEALESNLINFVVL